jgi:hypothetical protein
MANSRRASRVKKFYSLSGFLLTLFLVVSFMPMLPIASVNDAVKWTRFNIPAEGSAGGWALAHGSDLQHLTRAFDGTLYAYGKGLTYTFYKSINGGDSWSATGRVQDNIVAIATSPDDASNIYYATQSTVYRSRDGGKNFSALLASPGGAGSNHKEITSLAVSRTDGNIVAVGTRDTDAAQFGGVYTLDEAKIITTWTDTNLGNFDVYAVFFSPNYATSNQMVAVTTNETDTFVTLKSGDGAWGAAVGDARLNKDNAATHSPVVVGESAIIVFPDDYEADPGSSNNVLFVAIDTGTGNGDVYKIKGAESPDFSQATDLNAAADFGMSNVDVTGLAIFGDVQATSLAAGAADSAQVYFSPDGGKGWTKSRKEPTGQSNTYVLMSPDVKDTGRIYTATTGSESAFSLSEDKGSTWHQISFIDTQISTIVDAAPSPRYDGDNTIFLLTFGGKHSLWRSLDGGNRWQRVYSSALTGVDSIKFARLPPQYGVEDNRTLFLAGESNGLPVIWKSSDNGLSFRRRVTRNPTSGDAIPVDVMTVVDDASFFIGSFDGSSGLVFYTTNNGLTYAAGAATGSQSLNSMVLSPDYGHDKTILSGNTNGWVFLSDNNGSLFEPIPTDATSPPLTGQIAVAFDPDFVNNKVIYAASSTANKGIYRFIVGSSTSWESINGTLPSGALINQLAAGSEGTLYAANSKANGGMERSLNPTYSRGPTFETVTNGLSDGATLAGLWSVEIRLWSADTTNVRLMTFNDTLTSAITPTSPANKASGIGALTNHTVKNVRLDWSTLEGATSYQWQIDSDTDLSTVPSGFDNQTSASSASTPALDPATTYYWRVRAKEPVLSPWSERRSFTTVLDTEAIALRLESPGAGASGVEVKPLFQWTAVSGATSYELLVSKDANFTSPSVIKNGDYALTATAWESDLSLDNNTTYYWKVRAINASTQSPWSAVGAFTTEPAAIISIPAPVPTATTPSTIISELSTARLASQPTVPPTLRPGPAATTVPTAAATPAPIIIQSPDTPIWLFYGIGVLLLTMILMLIIIIMLVVNIRN